MWGAPRIVAQIQAPCRSLQDGRCPTCSNRSARRYVSEQRRLASIPTPANARRAPFCEQNLRGMLRAYRSGTLEQFLLSDVSRGAPNVTRSTPSFSRRPVRRPRGSSKGRTGRLTRPWKHRWSASNREKDNEKPKEFLPVDKQTPVSPPVSPPVSVKWPPKKAKSLAPRRGPRPFRPRPRRRAPSRTKKDDANPMEAQAVQKRAPMAPPVSPPASAKWLPKKADSTAPRSSRSSISRRFTRPSRKPPSRAATSKKVMVIPKFCTECGTLAVGAFCGECGHKHELIEAKGG